MFLSIARKQNCEKTFVSDMLFEHNQTKLWKKMVSDKSQLPVNDRTHDQKTKPAKKNDLLWPENKTVQ